MSSKYTVLQQPVETLLSWIKSGEIAIPEIQRPFVWKSTKVRDLIDSLYMGYPVGYIITWRNPDIRLRNGELSQGKRIIIDGQQRITALTASIIGHRVLNAEYKEVNIRIAYHPVEEKFEVLGGVLEKDPQWIHDISPILKGEVSMFRALREYCDKNPDANPDLIEQRLDFLKRITTHQIGIIELDASLDIDEVTEIFIRINQKGVKLSNADFVMSKIAADDEHEGNKMRRMIDYFCRLVVDKSFNRHILDNDKEFVAHRYYRAINWMANATDNIYQPDYVDVLRVALTYQFHRGKFADLVALLSGRNFDTRKYEAEIANESYLLLEKGLLDFFNQYHYQNFLMLVHAAGFIDKDMIAGKNSLNFAYALYLKLKSENYADADIKKYVKRWLVFAMLTARYSGSSDSLIDSDIRRINEEGIEQYLEYIELTELNESFFAHQLTSQMTSRSKNNSGYIVYLASKCRNNTRAFLSKDTTIKALIEQRGDEHHLFPRAYLEKNRFSQTDFNQIANYVYTEQYTNIRLKDTEPRIYFQNLRTDIEAGRLRFGTIEDWDDLIRNLEENEIPISILDGTAATYKDFLEERKKLMAEAIRRYYYSL